jgi:endonuclease/exonuclease/phosphatase family metal-dependent hydrolase
MRIYHLLMAGFGAAVAIVTGLSQVSAQEWVAPALPRIKSADGALTLSVMTYNVAGLPFPVRIGRDAAAERIGERLRQMRAQGVQPDVVVLQEAFGEAQRAIGRVAGYRYAAFGPDAAAAASLPGTQADRRFAEAARFSLGERSGKLFGSGLVILSDYPIERVARLAFPSYACAGFDCLANKGVLLASVRVPGAGGPVAVATFHLNAKKASGAPRERRDHAFDLQVAAVRQFLSANLAAGVPFVIAGDTNIGKSVERRQSFLSTIRAIAGGNGAGARNALATCLAPHATCRLGGVADLRATHGRSKDWQLYGSGDAVAVTPVAADAPFGRDPQGRMLSDHVGYTTVYRLTPRVERPLQIASR